MVVTTSGALFPYSAAEITPQTGRQGADYPAGSEKRVRPSRPGGSPADYYWWHQNGGARTILPLDITSLRRTRRKRSGQTKPRTEAAFGLAVECPLWIERALAESPELLFREAGSQLVRK